MHGIGHHLYAWNRTSPYAWNRTSPSNGHWGIEENLPSIPVHQGSKQHSSLVIVARESLSWQCLYVWSCWEERGRPVWHVVMPIKPSFPVYLKPLLTNVMRLIPSCKHVSLTSGRSTMKFLRKTEVMIHNIPSSASDIAANITRTIMQWRCTRPWRGLHPMGRNASRRHPPQQCYYIKSSRYIRGCEWRSPRRPDRVSDGGD